MKIKIIAIGKTKWKFLQSGMDEFSKRLDNYVSFDFQVIPDLKKKANLSIGELQKQEGELFLKQVQAGDELILLDENGKEYTSVNFSKQIQNYQLRSVKRLIFVIGGAHGFSDQIYQRANGKLSLSKMTYSHQLIRLIFLEQLYRAFTILKGEKYHNE